VVKVARFEVNVDVSINGSIVVEAEDEDAALDRVSELVEAGVINDTDPCFYSNGIEPNSAVPVEDSVPLTYPLDSESNATTYAELVAKHLTKAHGVDASTLRDPNVIHKADHVGGRIDWQHDEGDLYVFIEQES
jgi:hypothetical protein